MRDFIGSEFYSQGMRKNLRLVALLIPMILIASNSYAAVKPGSNCKKVGTKSISGGKSYTCIKIGKKLVWDKGVLIPVAQPVPSETKSPVISVPKSENAPFKPWDNQATAKEINDAAQAKFRSWATEQIKANPNHRVIIQQGLTGSRLKNFTAADKLGARIFGQFFDGKYATVLGTSEEWVVQQLNANGGSYTKCADNSGNRGLNYCHDGGLTQGYVISSDADFQESNPGADGTSLLAHEYFHGVQNQMSNLVGKQTIREGQDFSKHLFPAWLQEGSANFVGFSVGALAMEATYWGGRDAMLKYAPLEPSTNRNLLKDYEIRNGPGNYSPTYPYITGQLASEFIVASVGFQKFLDIWINYKETQNFDKSFAKSIGMSIEEFYDKFEKARTNMGLPDVTWRLICLTNYPINDIPNKLPVCRLNMPNSGSNSLYDSTSPNPENQNGPPPVDRNSNVDGLGCRQGDEVIKNNFGSFTCTTLANGNNLWKKTG